MEEMITFRYSGFWDVPRYIVLRYGRWLFYLHSAFDDELDDYEKDYSVYRVPDIEEYRFDEDPWLFSKSTGLTFVGKVAVQNVEFDERKRKKLVGSVLDPFVELEESTR